MYWVETIVCSGAKGKDAKLRRKLQSRQEYKRRQPGCVAAWLGRGPDDKTMLLVQSVFKSQKDWKRITQEIQTKLDTKDGGIEGLMLGPPLVGVFELSPDEFILNTSES